VGPWGMLTSPSSPLHGPTCHWTSLWRVGSLVQFGPEHSESLAHTCHAGPTVCLLRDSLHLLALRPPLCLCHDEFEAGSHGKEFSKSIQRV
jgi:hypothetical protein